MKATAHSDAVLTAFLAATPHLQLHTGWPTRAGTANQAGAARVALAGLFGAVSGGSVSNNAAIRIDNIPPGTYPYATIFDAASGGNAKYILPLGEAPKSCVVDAAGVTNNDILAPAHGLAADDYVAFFQVQGLSLPGGLSEGVLYRVIATGLTADTFRVSTTQGGAAVDITSKGAATWRKMLPRIMVGPGNGSLEFAAGALVISES